MWLTFPYFKLRVWRDSAPSAKMDCTSACKILKKRVFKKRKREKGKEGPVRISIFFYTDEIAFLKVFSHGKLILSRSPPLKDDIRVGYKWQIEMSLSKINFPWEWSQQGLFFSTSPALLQADWQKTTGGRSPAESWSPLSTVFVAPARVMKKSRVFQEFSKSAKTLSMYLLQTLRDLTSVILPTTTSPTSPLNLHCINGKNKKNKSYVLNKNRLHFNTLNDTCKMCACVFFSIGSICIFSCFISQSYRVFRGLTQMSLSTLCTSPATEAVSFSSST